MGDAQVFNRVEGGVVNIVECATAVFCLAAVEVKVGMFVTEQSREKLIDVHTAKLGNLRQISKLLKNVLLLRIMKAKNIFYLIAVLLIGKSLYGQVQPTWESINERGYPQWFSDAKLGIFIHWGVYSVPAYASLEGYAEWYYRGLMTNDDRKAFQERIYGKDFKYEDFAPMWKAE